MPDPREWHRILSTEDLGDEIKVEVRWNFRSYFISPAADLHLL
jgi:hypothetical protein